MRTVIVVAFMTGFISGGFVHPQLHRTRDGVGITIDVWRYEIGLGWGGQRRAGIDRPSSALCSVPWFAFARVPFTRRIGYVSRNR